MIDNQPEEQETIDLAIAALARDIEKMYSRLAEAAGDTQVASKLTPSRELANGFIGHRNKYKFTDADDSLKEFKQYLEKTKDPLWPYFSTYSAHLNLNGLVRFGLNDFFRAHDQNAAQKFRSFLRPTGDNQPLQIPAFPSISQPLTSSFPLPSPASKSSSVFVRNPQTSLFILTVAGSMPLWYFASKNWGLLGASEPVKNLLLMHAGAALVATCFILAASLWNRLSQNQSAQPQPLAIAKLFGLTNPAWFFNRNPNTANAAGTFAVNAGCAILVALFIGYRSPTAIYVCDGIGAAFMVCALLYAALNKKKMAGETVEYEPLI